MLEDLKESLAALRIVENKILADIEKNPNDMYLKAHVTTVRRIIEQRQIQIRDLEESR